MDKPATAHAEFPAADEPPPPGGWRRMYALVLAVLAAEIVIFTIVSRAWR